MYTEREDFDLSGVHGLEVSGGTLSWRPGFHIFLCGALKLCPADYASLPGPWGDDPWTCTVLGERCSLPYDFHGVSHSACTQQFSDPYDLDEDGSVHNGHPQCQSTSGLSLCGPCSCAAGEEQTYSVSRVYAHTPTVYLVTCIPCAAGRFKSLVGNGTLDTCEQCLPGTSSPPGATACEGCLPGMFNDHEMLGCASCQPGFFGDEVERTMCQECEEGRHASTEQQTACDLCQDGFYFVAKTVGCQPCSPGTFITPSMSACSRCETGYYQHNSGRTRCYQCSEVLNPGGPNLHLWTTMVSSENMGWLEVSGSQSVSDCGCAEGAWADALGQCHGCGEGITCKGFGEVEVLPGYFASAASAGFVWRCHGADWARCPGGRPGTCALHRLNTSIACEECDPYTRMTNDGPCKARRVVLVVGPPQSQFFVQLREIFGVQRTRKQLLLTPTGARTGATRSSAMHVVI